MYDKLRHCFLNFSPRIIKIKLKIESASRLTRKQQDRQRTDGEEILLSPICAKFFVVLRAEWQNAMPRFTLGREIENAMPPSRKERVERKYHNEPECLNTKFLQSPYTAYSLKKKLGTI